MSFSKHEIKLVPHKDPCCPDKFGTQVHMPRANGPPMVIYLAKTIFDTAAFYDVPANLSKNPDTPIESIDPEDKNAVQVIRYQDPDSPDEFGTDVRFPVRGGVLPLCLAGVTIRNVTVYETASNLSDIPDLPLESVTIG
jgi:hypothetical protein